MGIRPSIRPSLRLTMLTVLVLLAVPGTASAFVKAFWAPGFISGKNPFPTLHRLGVGMIEQDLDWASVAPTQPSNPTDPHDAAYRWPASLANTIATAQKYHMRVLLQVSTAPSWANGGEPQNWAPTDPTDYANFMTAAARHYSSVHLWMVWGEPTRKSNFSPLVPAKPGTKLDSAQQAAPHKYAEMLDDAYGALKQVSKANLVIGGSTYSAGQIDTQQWIENLRLPNGKPPRMDIYAHNPFSWRPPKFSSKPSAGGQVQFPDLRRLAGWIDQYLGRPLHVGKPIPIFISEWNEPTAPEQEFKWYLNKKTAAKWVSEALSLCRHWKRIYGLGWIELYDQPPFENAGLLTKKGKKKPDFYSFARG